MAYSLHTVTWPLENLPLAYIKVIYPRVLKVYFKVAMYDVSIWLAR